MGRPPHLFDVTYMGGDSSPTLLKAGAARLGSRAESSHSLAMFDVSPDEISRLDDVELRELVGRLCEAELECVGLPVSAVRYGGDQRAADGGIDVRVELPAGTAPVAFIPCPSTSFQVKAQDMRRAQIAAEMRPAGRLRPTIRELAEEDGAYIIVSSRGTVAETRYRERLKAMRDALVDLAAKDRLHTGFYDRTRLATWVRRHPGIVLWVKERVGRPLSGWRPYGAWAGGQEGFEAEYLLDDKLRLCFGPSRKTPARSLVEAIDELRDLLAQPQKAVRLVGMSGVGKTRLVQALFDPRVGFRPLRASWAVYANLSDNPDPQPMGLAADLIANRRRAVLVVDNSPADLHRRLAEQCRAADSTVSLLTVEYDVREDQPEGTEVVTLDASSPGLTEKLIRRRYPHVSRVDARRIADFSGGNARIAIALAETLARTETLAGLSDDDLFQRLFNQRHEADGDLLAAAEACALVYSFEGETIDGEAAELPTLAALADQTTRVLFGHVSELLRRDLVQRRGVWRAVLPHAIANRLAARALESIPHGEIDRALVTGGSERLAQSFSRRLSFLHDHPKAVEIAEAWLAPSGLLGDVAALNESCRAMFRNAAPVSPVAALQALERVGSLDPAEAAKTWGQHRGLLRSLAYDAPLFDRSADLLSRVATAHRDERERKDAADTFVSMFGIYLSGTHATVEQRLSVVERLLTSSEPKECALGLAALDKALQSRGFVSGNAFEFGARPRDYGFQPRCRGDAEHWYGAALALLERLAFESPQLHRDLRALLARNFRHLWTSAAMFDVLERQFRRFAALGFWRDGWAACRQTTRFDRDHLLPEVSKRLAALEAELRPVDLAQRVRAFALGGTGKFTIDIMDEGTDLALQIERLDAYCLELGEQVALDRGAFDDVLPDLLRGGDRVWTVGQGLARGADDLRAMWGRLIAGLDRSPCDERNSALLSGFMQAAWERDRELTSALLDEAVEEPAVAPLLPALHMTGQLDARGVARLRRALREGKTGAWMFRALQYGRASDHATAKELTNLLLDVAEHPNGLIVALDILQMRLFSDRSAGKEPDAALLQLGAALLRRIDFRKNDKPDDYRVAELARACLLGGEGADVATQIIHNLMQVVARHETFALDHDELLGALLGAQPQAALDALFGDPVTRELGREICDRLDGEEESPVGAVALPELIRWCDVDPGARYPIAASLIPFRYRAAAQGPVEWSEHAKALLASAPDPTAVLRAFIARFASTSWSGSRAASIETNAGLLDCVDQIAPSVKPNLIASSKADLRRQVEREREWETQRDRESDERFE